MHVCLLVQLLFAACCCLLLLVVYSQSAVNSHWHGCRLAHNTRRDSSIRLDGQQSINESKLPSRSGSRSDLLLLTVQYVQKIRIVHGASRAQRAQSSGLPYIYLKTKSFYLNVVNHVDGQLCVSGQPFPLYLESGIWIAFLVKQCSLSSTQSSYINFTLYFCSQERQAGLPNFCYFSETKKSQT